MDGRRRIRWAAAGLVAVAVTGCNRNATVSNDPNPLAPPAGSRLTPDVSKVFGQKAGPTVPASPAVEPVSAKPKKPGEPLKPETEVALAETEVEAALAEGRPAAQRDQLLDSARQRYQRALKARPKDQAALLGLARLYTKSGDAEHALATYKTAQDYYPKDHALAHRTAAARAQLGDWDGAVESCRSALALDPENRTYQKTLGFCLAQGGKWDDAYEAMARFMPEAEARYFVGRALYDHDKTAEARRQMEMAVTADPKFDPARRFLTDLDRSAASTPDAGVRAVKHEESAGDR